jgi:hypothetical protein
MGVELRQPEQRRLVGGQFRIDGEIVTPSVWPTRRCRRPNLDLVSPTFDGRFDSRDCVAGIPTRALQDRGRSGRHSWPKSANRTPVAWVPREVR